LELLSGDKGGGYGGILGDPTSAKKFKKSTKLQKF
jgi:hypothetical protein